MTMIAPKIFALGAVMGDLGLLALSLAQSQSPSPVDLVTGGAAGGVVSVVTWLVYKEKVDRHERVLESKADAKDLAPLRDAIQKIEANLHFLVQRAMDHKD